MMSENFTVEIISPDKSVLKMETAEVTIPSYEGQMGILKDHISIITFLKPGLITIKDNEKEKKVFVEEGTVEFSNNILLILSSTAKILENIDKSKINEILNEAENKLKSEEISDKERYFLSHKVNTLREIN